MISLIFRDGVVQKVPGVNIDELQKALKDQVTINTKFIKISNVIINLSQLQEAYGESEGEEHG